MEESPELRPIDPADLAWRDDLTGAWNRRYLRRLLDVDWQGLVATHGTITLLVLDLDLFKEINDAHGHLAGDHVLVQAANQLRSSFRTEDRLIRYGGDEFVVTLFGAGGEEARALAERARTALETVEVADFRSGETVTLPLSFSMGVASFPVDGASGEEILSVADRRLYEEKRARQAAAAPADRGRRKLLSAAALALVVLVVAAWIEWRYLHRTPPPPPAAEAGAMAAGGDSPSSAAAVPPAEILVRDEQELIRLRGEVQRLQTALTEPHPADDRERFNARIRELEARLTEAGDRRSAVSGSPAAGAVDAGVGASGSSGASDATAGMRIGERRTRDGLEIPPGLPPPAESGPPTAASGSAATSTPRPADSPGAAPVVVLPQLLRAIRPDYPRAARERRRMATVELRVRVDAAGKVLSAEPVGPPAGFGFDESAREAALSAQFRPGRRDGVAVEMETRLAIRFLLERPPR